MRIKRLEIFGFKSFPQRVSFPFPPGISAIVGPNGSGKSNVIDALRWILGEQNPRLLRVREMSDLIFAGVNGRGPEFAEVRLILENQGRAPKKFENFSEISVARRLYRDGESEFFINNRACRLKDIVYLFLDTGVHARGYGIIDQGQVGQFLDQPPKERRRFLEELAGVARYKLKREETERQITRTRENLIRIKDILAEVENHLTQLRQQAEETKAYLALQGELQALERLRLHLLYLRYHQQRREIRARLEELRKNLEALERQKHHLEPQRQEKQAQIELLREKISEKEVLWQRQRQKSETLKREVEDLLRKEAQWAQRLAQLQGQGAEKKERLQAIRTRLKEIQAEKEKAKLKVSASEAALKEKKEQNRGLFQRKEELEKELQAQRERLLELKHELQNLEAERKRLEKKKHEIRKEAQELTQARKKLKERKESLLREEKVLTSQKEELEKAWQTRAKQRETLKRTLEKKQEQFEKLREEVSLLRLRERELREETNWLQRFLKERQSPAAKVLQKKKISATPLFETVKLSLEEEKKAEQAFPELLEALCLPPQEVERALQILLQEKLSALLFGGRAPEEFLRKRLAQVEFTEEALLSTPSQPSKILLTPEGVILEPDGLLRVRGEKGEGLLQKRRALEEKTSQLKGLLEELKAKERLLKAQKEAVDKARQDLRVREEGLEQDKKKLKELEKRLERILLEQENLEAREAFLEERSKALQRKEKELKMAWEELEQKGQEIGRMKTVHHNRLRAVEEEHHLLQKEIKAALAKVRALELEASAHKERMKQAQREEERLLKEEARLSKEIERLRREMEQQNQKLSEIKKRLSEQREALTALQNEVSLLQETLKELREEEHQLEKKWRDLEEEWNLLSQELSKKEKRLNKLEIDLAEVELRLRHVQEQAQEHFSTTLPLKDPPPPAPIKDLEGKIQELKIKLKGFGAVNLAAIEELEKAEERHRFLLEQKADLERALADLEEAVKQINRTCRERLRDTLEAANAKLALVFPLLFPGGQAELRFTDTEDPLSAGLDLALKLPGKPIRYLSMLSGGEKALAALGVLCAFYLVKPGPFCILDEVDAPLDEANTERFTRLLEELNKHAQIILVTHNKRVMEIADALFGITMEEKGISKVVSVKLV